MHLTDAAKARVAACATVPQVLAASFGAFELIGLLARQHEDRDPCLFAAFMTTAAAAADGFDAIASAPSLPAPQRPDPAAITGTQPAADIDSLADAVAALAAALARKLTRAADLAPAAADRQACQLAARAAEEICQLMTRADDHSRPG